MKNIAWVIALIVLVFVGDRIGGWVLKNLTEKSQFRYSRLYKGGVDADILLVGNSRGLMFYQPFIEEITGKSTLNLSYNGLPIDLARVLVEDYLENNQKPSLLLLDVTMCDRKNEQMIASFNTYAPFSNRLADFIHQKSPKNAIGGQVSHLYRFNSEIFQRALFYLNKSDENWLLDRVITNNLVESIKDHEPYTIGTSDYLLGELKKVVNVAQKNGIEVHLVINPYYPPFADKIVNLTAFKKDVETITGLPVHNYAKAVVDTNGFGDYQHLNKTGSKAYLSKLQAAGLLETSKLSVVE